MESLARGWVRNFGPQVEVAGPFIQMETGMEHTWACNEPRGLAKWGLLKVLSTGDFVAKEAAEVELILPVELPPDVIAAVAPIPEKEPFWMRTVGLGWEARAVYLAAPGEADEIRYRTGFATDPTRFRAAVAALKDHGLIGEAGGILSQLRAVSDDEHDAAESRYDRYCPTVWLPKSKASRSGKRGRAASGA